MSESEKCLYASHVIVECTVIIGQDARIATGLSAVHACLRRVIFVGTGQ
jgi:hypothetical protein